MYFQSQKDIEQRINHRQVKIASVGLGRVGLPLAATLAGQGFKVVGIDINPQVVDRINYGESPFPDETGLGKLLQDTVSKGLFRASPDIAAIVDSDFIIVSLPTLIKGTEPDISAIERAVDGLARNISPGKVVVLESTVPPLTTQNVLGKGIENSSGLKPGKDFGLAYSPERTQAPQVLRDLKTYPKIVGGIDEKSTLITSLVYSTFAPGIVKMSSILAAEIDKVIENSYRDVNIAFANELARICEIFGVDVYEVIAAANSQPHSHILNPGLVGGHCIPMVPYFLISAARKQGLEARLMQNARDINESVFQHISGMIDKGSKKITVLGLSFKKDVQSFDTSHTLKLADLLIDQGHDVTIHDPYLDGTEFRFKTDPNLYHALEGADCLVLATAHSAYEGLDFDRVRRIMKGNLVIDIRGMFSPEKVSSSGLRYKGLGRIVP